MTNRPKAIGTWTETAVVRYARAHGFSGADTGHAPADRPALHGRNDVGDVHLCPGVILEVKGGKAAEQASDADIAVWVAQAEAERTNAGAHVGILVTKRKGVGAPNAGRWNAFLTLGTIARLRDYPPDIVHAPADTAVVRMSLESALVQLRCAGYGDPLASPAAAAARQRRTGARTLYAVPVSPDCVVAKHDACAGASWDDVADAPADCPCLCHRVDAP